MSLPGFCGCRQIWEREVMIEMEIDEPGEKTMLAPGPTIIKFSKIPHHRRPHPQIR